MAAGGGAGAGGRRARLLGKRALCVLCGKEVQRVGVGVGARASATAAAAGCGQGRPGFGLPGAQGSGRVPHACMCLYWRGVRCTGRGEAAWHTTRAHGPSHPRLTSLNMPLFACKVAAGCGAGSKGAAWVHACMVATSSHAREACGYIPLQEEERPFLCDVHGECMHWLVT